MRSDFQEILILPDGIYRVKYHLLTLKAIRSLRSRIENDIFKLSREINTLQRQIAYKTNQIKEKNSMLNKLSEENIAKWIELEKERLKKIEEKANEFLRNLIGKDNWNELQKKGYFCFTSPITKRKYRIKKNGMLQELNGNYWYDCCVIKPNIPLPDIIASIFTTVQNSPRFFKQTRRTKTNEEMRK